MVGRQVKHLSSGIGIFAVAGSNPVSHRSFLKWAIFLRKKVVDIEKVMSTEQRRVTVINQGSVFRGLVGTVIDAPHNMPRVAFDEPPKLENGAVIDATFFYENELADYEEPKEQ